MKTLGSFNPIVCDRVDVYVDEINKMSFTHATRVAVLVKIVGSANFRGRNCYLLGWNGSVYVPGTFGRRNPLYHASFNTIATFSSDAATYARCTWVAETINVLKVWKL